MPPAISRPMWFLEAEPEAGWDEGGVLNEPQTYLSSMAATKAKGSPVLPRAVEG